MTQMEYWIFTVATKDVTILYPRELWNSDSHVEDVNSLKSEIGKFCSVADFDDDCPYLVVLDDSLEDPIKEKKIDRFESIMGE